MTAICITGSHRSGTSMVTRMLNLCGLELGPTDEIMAPGHDNPGGFWEDTRFVEINDRLLNEFGAGWDCPPDDDVDFSDRRLSFFRADARALARSFGDAPVWGWKDPRNSLLLPFWQGAVPRLKTVVLLRNPLDVAASLNQRNGSSYALSLTLWRRYNERIVAATRERNRIVTRYDAYFEDPAAELKRVLAFIGLEPSDEAIDSARETIAESARHHVTDDKLLLDANVDPAILTLYAELGEQAGAPHYAVLRERALAGVGANGSRNGARSKHGARAVLGAARLEPAGRLEQLEGQPTALGRELARIRAHFGEHADSLSNLSAELLKVSRSQGELVEQVARIEPPQHDAIDERLGRLERLVADGHQAQERRIEELAQFCRYLVNRLEQPQDDSERGRARLRMAAAIHTITTAGAGVILMGWEGKALSEMIVGRRARFIPQTPDGQYAEKQPTTSEALIAQLEAHRADGAEHAVCPGEMLWWRASFAEFWTYLERRYPVVWEDPSAGLVYGLGKHEARPRRAWEAEVEAVVREFRARLDRDPAILDWAGGRLAPAFPELAVFAPPEGTEKLPYLPASVDLVAVGERGDLASARSVARTGVIVLRKAPDGTLAADVEWRSRAGRRRKVTSASIVIPSWNGIYHTEKCVIALGETLPRDYDCEIVVVDDASTDDTAPRLAALAKDEPRLKVVRNAENSGFIMTCNRGAAESRGDYVIMLNNDTVPLAGWLEPLLAVFRHYPDAGAATGKLIFPDGVLQEAGSVIFSDSRAANFGKWEPDTQHPLFNYVREVDYGSGALLAAPRKLWKELGGFDVQYRPIYCDDSDFCFKVRKRGLRVYYQPECVVVHVEGATSGRDESKGDKRYQVINRKKLAKRWRRELTRQPPYPDGFSHETLHDIVVREEHAPARRSRA